ncbi:hypothetical protein PV379_04900 [Streptomyces caniscabiei]|nr:hypothetical protein [Streptomyces caniscabiei]MDX2776668.1 hypothetical protein [Streptomyces caniscabiei]
MSEAEQMMTVIVGGIVFVAIILVRARIAAKRERRRHRDEWNR